MATATTSLERPLPHNVEAERSILGAILLDNNALNPAIEKLKAEDFFHDHHRRIFQQMVALGESQQDRSRHAHGASIAAANSNRSAARHTSRS